MPSFDCLFSILSPYTCSLRAFQPPPLPFLSHCFHLYIFFHHFFQGTFVNISSNNCVPCSYCSKGETVIQECIWQDTICKKVNAETITPPQQTCPPTLTTDPDQQELQRQVVQSTPESRSQKGNLLDIKYSQTSHKWTSLVPEKVST